MPGALKPGRRLLVLGVVALGATALGTGLVTARATPVPPSGSCAEDPVVLGQTERPRCCFTNSAYSGVCVVEPAKNETCSSILNYLNSDQSAGKSYCNATTIRGGWASVRCPDESGPEGGGGR